MNYRHAFHAGNFADVFKHVILVHLLKALQRKDKGFVYIDTHAGPGRYDLKALASQKSGEFRDGIGRLWASPPEDASDYLAAVGGVNRGSALRYYPGSPQIARFFLRAQDRMRLCEREPNECRRLCAEFAGDKQVQVLCGDGYAALAGWLPPPERRGLVVIDPPYERVDEWESVLAALGRALDRWATGIYAVWYPIKVGAPHERFKVALAGAEQRRVLAAELRLWPDDTPFRLNGCGMVVVNPPWRLDESLRNLVPALGERLKQGSNAPRAQIEWLVPE